MVVAGVLMHDNRESAKKQLGEIDILSTQREKKTWEQQHRFLWQTCFHDPKHYEDFYFDKVYTTNTVYAMEDKGMVHLNWYRCQVLGETIELPYIVGVSTAKEYRRCGVMRNLLDRIFSDLEEQEIPFTYLMPAKTEYYTSFGFQSISQRQEIEMALPKEKELQKDNILFVSYSDIKAFTKEEKAMLFEQIDSWLKEQFAIYTVHDEAYFDLLYAEKSCQGGDVIFCFEQNTKKLFGMFAYVMEEELPYVEQILLRKSFSNETADLQRILEAFFKSAKQVRIIKSYPYMVRIVHRKAFISIFQEYLNQQGIVPWNLSDEQLLNQLFAEKDIIYFAEIV